MKKLTDHILAMKDDCYLAGHPEWEEIVKEAEKINALCQKKIKNKEVAARAQVQVAKQ